METCERKKQYHFLERMNKNDKSMINEYKSVIDKLILNFAFDIQESLCSS